jgi:hypothetical protein
LSSKLISYDAAARLIDPDKPPHKRTLKRWPGFPQSVKPSGCPNGREFLVAAEVDAWITKQAKRRAS